MKKILLVLLLLSLPAFAFSPDETLKDPALEMRARALTLELRCPVCQGEAIGESNADLARDLRRMVRERLKAGDTDEQVRDMLKNRYGDYILFTPPFAPRTWLLWLTPGLVVVGGLFLFRRLTRAKR